MPKPHPLAALQNILANLYSSENQWRRIAVVAGLDIGRIDLVSNAMDCWYTILREAERSNRVTDLVYAALQVYGDNSELRQAIADYHAFIKQGGKSEREPSLSTDSDINTGGGSYIAGNASTDGGDFTGRDKTIHVQGDEVGGDKVGRDKFIINAERVEIHQYPEVKAQPATDKSSASDKGKDTPSGPAIQNVSAGEKIDIFLSYSRIDAEIMRRLRDDLRVAGFSVWTDDVGLEPGTPSWQGAIEEAIQASRCMVVLLSPEAKKSKWVEIEVTLAEDLGLRIFPLLIRGEERNAVPLRLLVTQRIDLRTEYQKAVKEQLVPALRRYLPKNKPSEVKQTEQVEPLKASEQSRIELSSAKKRETSAVQANRPPIKNQARWKLLDLFLPPPTDNDSPLDLGLIVILVIIVIILLVGYLYPRDGRSPTPTLTAAPSSTPTHLAVAVTTVATTPKPPPTLIMVASLANTPVPTTSPIVHTRSITSGSTNTVTASWSSIDAIALARSNAIATSNANMSSLIATSDTQGEFLHSLVIGSASITSTATLPRTPTPTPEAGATFTNPKDSAVYVWIPGGEFMMGSSITDTLAIPDERPQHKIILDGFWIMQAEVTNAQYKRCIEAKVCIGTDTNLWNDSTYAQHPVVSITWEQAQKYANWVGGRLPTEAEWEHACRGTEGRIYPWGNEAPDADLLNYVGSKKKDTTPVGSYPPGANGLYDMAGNVQEWTADWYDYYYNAPAPEHNPKGPNSGISKVVRGGSFASDDYDVRCSARFTIGPSTQSFPIGFRVVAVGSP